MALLVSSFFFLWAFAAISTLLREDMFAWVVSEFALCAVAALLFMSMVFFIAQRMKRIDLVDAAWGPVFIVIALTSYLLQDGVVLELDTQTLVTVLVMVWGGRLAWHIGGRIRSSTQEDPRYVELRSTWRGNKWANAYIRIYVVQAVLALFISVPVIHINLFTEHGVSLLAWAGAAVWLVGYWFEVVGDRQLRDFVANPNHKGKLMTTGLWKYSRHPNYFGELTQWWGIFIICLSLPFGWVGVVGPVLISYLILFVSGIPLNEKRFAGRPGWAEYQDRTSALIPLPPRAR